MKTNTETKTQNKYIKSLKAAFPHTVPILAGFLFLGMTYGIYMNVSGFNFVYPMLMSMTIFAGSVEFVTSICCSVRSIPFRRSSWLLC